MKKRSSQHRLNGAHGAADHGIDGGGFSLGRNIAFNRFRKSLYREGEYLRAAHYTHTAAHTVVFYSETHTGSFLQKQRQNIVFAYSIPRIRGFRKFFVYGIDMMHLLML